MKKIDKQSIRYRKKENGRLAFAFLLPALSVLALFAIWPLIYTCVLSLKSGNMFTGGSHFAGLKNFKALLGDSVFLNSLKITLIYSISTTVLSMMLGFFFALLLDRKLPGTKIFRSLFFSPLMTSLVAISVVWMWIFHPDYGVLNEIFTRIGLPRLQWLNSSRTALLSLIIMGVWKNQSMCTILYLGGLQNISSEILEAAAMDHASKWRTMWEIKFPLVTPTTFLIMIMLLIQEVQIFTQAKVMTSGGPAKATNTVVFYMYEKAFTYVDYSYASAIAVVLFVVVLLLTLIQFRLSKKTVFYQ